MKAKQLIERLGLKPLEIEGGYYFGELYRKVDKVAKNFDTRVDKS